MPGLVLTRKPIEGKDTIIIHEDGAVIAKIQLTEASRGQAKMVLQAGTNVLIDREELYNAKRQQMVS